MVCPKCGSENVTISMEAVGSKTKKTSIGLGGHVNNAARSATAFCTFGMSNLVWRKAKGEEKSKAKLKKVCLCQNCGKSWFL